MRMIGVTFACGHRWLLTRAERATDIYCKSCGCKEITDETEVDASSVIRSEPRKPNRAPMESIADSPRLQRARDARAVVRFLNECGFRITEAPGPHDSMPGND